MDTRLVTHTYMVNLYLFVCTKVQYVHCTVLAYGQEFKLSPSYTRGKFTNDSKRIVEFRSVVLEESCSTEPRVFILLFLLNFYLVYWEVYTATEC